MWDLRLLFAQVIHLCYRYHRLTPAEKRELNLKRTLAQKRKRQREKELEELESILRETNDIQVRKGSSGIWTTMNQERREFFQS